jgi:hypothetical protein
MNFMDVGQAKVRSLFKPAPPHPLLPHVAKPREDGLFFYQAIDLPGLGSVPGVWDHRGSENPYLGGCNFSGKSVLDVGPANGFWSFEMEHRGASVTAIELGPNDRWDAVPHGGTVSDALTNTLLKSVDTVHQDFLLCREAKKSNVKVIRGSVYDTPNLVEKTDVALMGNVLQHFRDPFLAIEQVAKVVTERIVISESLWVFSSEFLRSGRLHLIPRSDQGFINHSWYQVSPIFVIETLKILGFGKIKSDLHYQKFMGTEIDPKPRMVLHFTCSAERGSMPLQKKPFVKRIRSRVYRTLSNYFPKKVFLRENFQ